MNNIEQKSLISKSAISQQLNISIYLFHGMLIVPRKITGDTEKSWVGPVNFFNIFGAKHPMYQALEVTFVIHEPV